MTKLVVDASAWIEYFEGSFIGKEFKDYIENADNEVWTSSVTVAELVSKAVQKSLNMPIVVSGLKSLTNIDSPEYGVAFSAGQIHADIRKSVKKFSLTDAFVLATARSKGARILTCDYDFKGFKEAILIPK